MTLKLIRSKSFANGTVYALETEDGFPIEVTDTFLPLYTKDAVGRHDNKLSSEHDYGDRSQRWMVGVSCMSGCPVRCKFCATGQLKKTRMLTADEIVQQIEFVLAQNLDRKFVDAAEHKVNYTRMGEPFLNIEAVKGAIDKIEALHPNTHHYISTIGVKGSDFSFVKGNVTLQLSLHSLDAARRDSLIPFPNKMSLEELGAVRTKSKLKTTLNMTLVDKDDFDIGEMKRLFDCRDFFVKLSPINPNCTSEQNGMGRGAVEGANF